MVMVILAVYPEGDLRQVCDRNITQPGISCGEDIRIQGVSHTCLRQGDSALNIFSKKSIFRRQVDKDAVLHSED